MLWSKNLQNSAHIFKCMCFRWSSAAPWNTDVTNYPRQKSLFSRCNRRHCCFSRTHPVWNAKWSLISLVNFPKGAFQCLSPLRRFLVNSSCACTNEEARETKKRTILQNRKLNFLVRLSRDIAGVVAQQTDGETLAAFGWPLLWRHQRFSREIKNHKKCQWLLSFIALAPRKEQEDRFWHLL